jgi:hypothetical protein
VGLVGRLVVRSRPSVRAICFAKREARSGGRAGWMSSGKDEGELGSGKFPGERGYGKVGREGE